MASQAHFGYSGDTFASELSYFPQFAAIESMVDTAKSLGSGKPTAKTTPKPKVMKKARAAQISCD